MTQARPPIALPRVLGPLAPRPRLTASIAVGVVAGAASGLLFPQLKASTPFIVGWDALAATFLVSILISMVAHGPAEIRARAARDDEGRIAILVLVLLAVAVSIGAVGVELSLAKLAHGLEKWLHIAAAFGTVTASWLMVQMIFTLHYAHEYYGPGDSKSSDRCLTFPSKHPPRYWDFIYFSFVIGMTAQVSDVTTSTTEARTLVLAHSVVSFFFNTAILALGVNLAANVVH